MKIIALTIIRITNENTFTAAPWADPIGLASPIESKQGFSSFHTV
jgi:hypothetical protein